MASRRFFTFITAFLSSAVLLALAYVAFVNGFCRWRMDNDHWLTYVYWHKLNAAQNTPSPKIVIMGGSASMFSIHSDVIGKMTGLPVVNMGMHVEIPFQLYDSIASQFLGEGDIIVLPLEYDHYITESLPYTDLPLSVLFGMAQELQSSLTWRQRAVLYLKYGYSWMRRLSNSKNSKRKQPSDSEIEYLKGLVARLRGKEWGKATRAAYSIKHCNEYGDMWIPLGQIVELTDMQPEKLAVEPVTPWFLSSYRRLETLAKSRNARLVLSYCNMNKHLTGLLSEKLPKRLHDCAIDIIGSPERFCFPDEYYYDTEYHMNQYGGEIYSIRLGEAICRYLGIEPKCHPSEHPEKIPKAQHDAAVLASQGWLPKSGFGYREVNDKEGDFYWTKDSSAELLVKIDQDKTASTIIGISLAPLLIPSKNVKEQTMRVKDKDDSPLAYFSFTLGGKQKVEFELPANAATNGVAKLKLDLPNAVSPIELGISKDTRKLGVKIFGIERKGLQND